MNLDVFLEMGYGLCGASISSLTCAVRIQLPAAQTPHRDGSFHALLLFVHTIYSV